MSFTINIFFINRYSRFNYTKQDVRIKIIVKQQCYGHFILYQSIIQIRGKSVSLYKQDVRIKIIVQQQCYGHFILYQSIIQIRGKSISDVIVSMLTSSMIYHEFELQSSNQRLYLYFCFSSKHAALTRNVLLKNCIVCF